jgi:predicted nucleic acid-binding Zn ribbon protein
MPTYVYRREDGSTFEIEQRITEPALTHDPDSGQRVERVISGAGLLFKGSGFYLTDYARASGSKETAGEASPSDAGSKKPADTTAGDTASPPKPVEATSAPAKSASKGGD